MFEVINAGERTAVVKYKGVIVATLVCERFLHDEENLGSGSEVVIQGLTVREKGERWRNTRHASTPSRGPGPIYEGEPTVEEIVASLVAEEDYANGERAVWALQDGDLVPTEGSKAFLEGVKDALKKRREYGKVTYYGVRDKFTVYGGRARVKRVDTT